MPILVSGGRTFCTFPLAAVGDARWRRMVKKLERGVLPVVLVMSRLTEGVVVGPICRDELEAPSGLPHRVR